MEISFKKKEVLKGAGNSLGDGNWSVV